jgi:hypothetical protein
MFALGPNSNTLTGGSTAQEPTSTLEPLQLTEDAKTLDLLFRHIDPTVPILPLSRWTISKLMEVARKYQIPGVAAWFEAEATKKLKRPNENDYDDSLLVQDPMFVLSLAAEHNLPDLCREAIRLRVSHGPIGRYDLNVPRELLLRIIDLQEERMQKYLNVVPRVIDAVLLTNAEPAMIFHCNTCGRSFGQWIYDLITILRYKLNWEAFQEEYSSESWSCVPGAQCLRWATKAGDGVRELKRVMKEEESKLPDLK